MVLRPCKGRNSCVLLFVMIKECKGKTVTVPDCQASHACKGKTDAKIYDCQTSQTGNSGDYVGPSKPCIVRSEVVQLYSVYNENADVLEESGPI